LSVVRKNEAVTLSCNCLVISSGHWTFQRTVYWRTA